MDTIFLVLSLFLPRITLLIFYFTHHIPANNVPFVGDFLLTVFLPRVLVLIYIVDNLGTSSPWFWIHLIAALMVFSGFGKYSHKKYKKYR
ncbi:MAG: hypothetical protein LWX07_08720 [Bacteroidetes bacterium]|nr:hypothetical protein [Bacteroidota bacterium]